uniref:Secreted protein n=1 Tax=Ixodes scapularis TaxID=6945 RepID=A0A4D5RCE2_IXOSC
MHRHQAFFCFLSILLCDSAPFDISAFRKYQILPVLFHISRSPLTFRLLELCEQKPLRSHSNKTSLSTIQKHANQGEDSDWERDRDRHRADG